MIATASLMPELTPDGKLILEENEAMAVLSEITGKEEAKTEATAILEADTTETIEEPGFDPAAAGSVEDPETVPEETIDPSEAGNAGETTGEAAEESPEVIPEETPSAEPGFDPSTAGNTAASGNVEIAGQSDIQITAEYAYKNPEGLDFDKRYVFHGKETSKLALQLTDEKKEAVSDIYVIYYVKAEKIAAEYRCMVVNGIAVCEETKPEELESFISGLPGMETGYEANPAGYQKFLEEIYGLEEEKEN